MPEHSRATLPMYASVAEAGRLLPRQPVLENFVHHNPLEDFEHMPFQAALDRAREIESVLSIGERTLFLTDVDPRKAANEALSDLCSAFLDRGAAKWAPRFRHRGFLYFFASLETLGFAPWRLHARTVAAKLQAEFASPHAHPPQVLASRILEENLTFFGVAPHEHEAALTAMMLELRGWAGMFARMEEHADEAPQETRVRLIEFCAVQSIILRSSVETVARADSWSPLRESFAEWIQPAPKRRAGHGPSRHSSAIAFVDQNAEHRERLEQQFERALLHTIETHHLPPAPYHGSIGAPIAETNVVAPAASIAAGATPATAAAGQLGAVVEVAPLLPTPQPPASPQTQQQQQQQQQQQPGRSEIVSAPAPRRDRPALQLYTCMDDREGSLRRHVEGLGAGLRSFEDSNGVETFGVAGFFGVPIRYKPVDGRDVMILAPEGQQPTAVLVEQEDVTHGGEINLYKARRRAFAKLALLFENASFSPIGSVALSSLLPLSLGRLWLMAFAPELKEQWRQKLMSTLIPPPHTDFDIPFSPELAATLLARTFTNVGTQALFAPVVIVLGHGSISVNNPYAAAYNCGACGGREGGPNARLLARIANDKTVRFTLLAKHGIEIPSDTVFIGGVHNTTTDTISLFDEERVPASHAAQLADVKALLDQARAANALERCHRFLLASHVHTAEAALEHVRIRASDAAEVRPELNHATNAAVVVGRRALTRGSFLDRRVFLPSYDPCSDDARGTNLEQVLGPALVVCSGINLEYLFSTIDEHHGAGTKAPLNVVSNLGVMQGTSGDLRTGLPTQMTEMHTPVRALFVIDAPRARVDAVFDRRPELKRLVFNQWVRAVVRDPYTGALYTPVDGAFAPLQIDSPADGSVAEFASFSPHYEHGLSVAKREKAMYFAGTAGMILSCVGPIVTFDGLMLNPYGSFVAVCGTLLALPVLTFSRRYLHGEHMFGRFSALSVGLLLGFNLVATAPTLELAMPGWALFGFASTFLIGAYNERPTVRNNATFAFAAYHISDMAMLVAAAFGGPHAIEAGHANPHLVAAGLLVAALHKSSQFPMTSLFVRSMEGPTPASALGYAGLSAHVGVVLLAGTMDLWYPLMWPSAVLAVIGGYTAVFGTLVAKKRADRKGAVARATSSTLGLIFVILSFGYGKAALLISLGHAAFRMVQILRAPNAIADNTAMRSMLGVMPWPKLVPDWLYRTSWALGRFDKDFNFLNTLQRMTSWIRPEHEWHLNKPQQLLATAVCVVLAGLPYTPVSDAFDELIIAQLPTSPAYAGILLAGHFYMSLCLIRFVFVKVLSSSSRFSKLVPHSANPPTSGSQHSA